MGRPMREGGRGMGMGVPGRPHLYQDLRFLKYLHISPCKRASAVPTALLT